MNIRRPLAAGLLLLPLAFVSAACVGVTRPQGWASPAIDGPTAFILEDKDRLTALTLAENSAQVSWSFPDDNKSDQKDIDLEAVYTQPLVDGETLYFVGYSGDLVAVNKANGNLVHSRQVDGHIAGGLVAEGDELAFGTTEGDIFLLKMDGFQPADGWDSAGEPVGGGIWSTPVLTANRIFVATMEGEVLALDRANGNVVWRFEHDGAIPTLALLDDGNLFAASLSKDVFVLDPGSGDVRTEFEAGDWVWNAPAFRDNIAYFGDFSGTVYALDITTGQAKWTYEGDSKVKSGPAIIDDVLVLVDRKPVVHFINLGDGTARGTVPILESGTVRADLVVDGGKAIIVTTDGHLFTADPAAAPGRVDRIIYGGNR